MRACSRGPALTASLPSASPPVDDAVAAPRRMLRRYFDGASVDAFAGNPERSVRLDLPCSSRCRGRTKVARRCETRRCAATAEAQETLPRPKPAWVGPLLVFMVRRVDGSSRDRQRLPRAGTRGHKLVFPRLAHRQAEFGLSKRIRIGLTPSVPRRSGRQPDFFTSARKHPWLQRTRKRNTSEPGF